jgi:hypothetical protein
MNSKVFGRRNCGNSSIKECNFLFRYVPDGTPREVDVFGFFDVDFESLFFAPFSYLVGMYMQVTHGSLYTHCGREYGCVVSISSETGVVTGWYVIFFC